MLLVLFNVCRFVVSYVSTPCLDVAFDVSGRVLVSIYVHVCIIF